MEPACRGHGGRSRAWAPQGRWLSAAGRREASALLPCRVSCHLRWAALRGWGTLHRDVDVPRARAAWAPRPFPSLLPASCPPAFAWTPWALSPARRPHPCAQRPVPQRSRQPPRPRRPPVGSQGCRGVWVCDSAAQPGPALSWPPFLFSKAAAGNIRGFRVHRRSTHAPTPPCTRMNTRTQKNTCMCVHTHNPTAQRRHVHSHTQSHAHTRALPTLRTCSQTPMHTHTLRHTDTTTHTTPGAHRAHSRTG